MTLFSQSAFDVPGKPINTTNYNILPQLSQIHTYMGNPVQKYFILCYNYVN